MPLTALRLPIPYRIRNRLPVPLINLVAPPRSAILDLPAEPASLETLAPEGRVLVVAPHPDDEALGCGGLLALLARAGREPRVAFVCDGSGSHARSRSHPPAALARLRRREALDAIAALGLPDDAADFLGFPDGAAPFADEPRFAEATAAIGRLLAAHDVATLVTPWRRDSSRDHRAATQAAFAAAAAAARPPRVLEYPVWAYDCDADAPAPGEARVHRLDVAQALPLKRRAVAAHRSQHGAVITDDPTAFRLPRVFLANFDRPFEIYFEGRP